MYDISFARACGTSTALDDDQRFGLGSPCFWIESIQKREGFYSVFKRGIKGVYQHCGEKHLHRYLAEFDFRHSNRSALGIGDKERVNTIAQGINGKWLTYRRAYKVGDAAPF
jgi:hypothetical protein